MIALVFSALFTVYLLIPEALFRLIFGFFISSRSFVLTRTEKAYRAVLITLLPFIIAWGLSWYMPLVRTYPFPVRENSIQQRRADYEAIAAAFYSDTKFTREGKQFWHAATRCTRRQARLVSWYLFFVVAEALFIGWLAANYPRLKNRKILRWLSDSFLTAYISQWHPLLPKHGRIVQVDILCTNDTLYQGELLDYFLKDGELSGIILDKPRRFDRPAYLKAKEELTKISTTGVQPSPIETLADPKSTRIDPKHFWRTIPSQNLYFFADKMININLTYSTPPGETPDPSAVEEYLERIRIAEDIGKLTVSIEKRPKTET